MDPTNHEADSIEVFLYKDSGKQTFQYVTIRPEEKFILPDGYCCGGAMLEFPGTEAAEFEYGLERGITYSLTDKRITKFLPGGIERTEFFPEPEGSDKPHPFIRFSVERCVYNDRGMPVPDMQGIRWGYVDIYGNIVIPAE